MWDPAIPAMQGASPQDLEPLGAAAISKQIVYLYRVGRVMVKVTAAGTPGNLAYALTPQHVADVAQIVAGKTIAADKPHLLRTSRSVYLGVRAAALGALRRSVGRAATAASELPQQLSDVALPWLSRLLLPAAPAGSSAAEPRAGSAAQQVERAQLAELGALGSSNATGALPAHWDEDEAEAEDRYVVASGGDLDDDYLFEEGETADVVIEGEEYEENDVTTTFMLGSPTTACARALCSIFGLHSHAACVANAGTLEGRGEGVAKFCTLLPRRWHHRHSRYPCSTPCCAVLPSRLVISLSPLTLFRAFLIVELALHATMAIIVLGLALGAMSGDASPSNSRSGFLVSEATSHVDHSASSMMDGGVRPSLPALSPGLSLSPNSRRSLPVM
jgi:hypothetical protein